MSIYLGTQRMSSGRIVEVGSPTPPAPVAQTVEEKDVNFYDYDGTRLYSYTAAQAQALTALPAYPTNHDNLTADEWNWTLTQIKNYLTANTGAIVNVGCIYHTTDGKTHIKMIAEDDYMTGRVRLKPSAANAVTVDWGDNSTDTWTSASVALKEHVYQTAGVYDITISNTTGSTYLFTSYLTDSESFVYTKPNGTTASTTLNTNNYYTKYTEIYLSSSVTNLNGAIFQNLYFLEKITIPNTVTALGTGIFYYCKSLKALNIHSSITTLPSSICASCYGIEFVTVSGGLTTIPQSGFTSCYSLKSFTVPSSVTSIPNSCFQYCYNLQKITMPNTVTSLGNSCFSNCYYLELTKLPTSLASFGTSCFSNCYRVSISEIPSGVTSLQNTCLQTCYNITDISLPANLASIGNNCFSYDNSLTKIVIPANVASLGTTPFNSCNGLAKYYFKPTSPPTLVAAASIYTQTGVKIYVPTGSLTAYQTAQYWSSLSSFMEEYNYTTNPDNI